MDHKTSQSGMHDFDFLVGSWSVLNRRKKQTSFWSDRAPEEETVWEEFPGHDRVEKQLDGRALVEHWEAKLPSGEQTLGLSVKAFEPATQEWSIVWIDNHNPLDFRPLVGTFADGVGTFFQTIETPDGQPLHVRFIWEHMTAQTAQTAQTALWQQALSFDGRVHWETNWVMEFTREH